MRLKITLGLLLAIITLSVYWQVGRHDFITLDDRNYVVINPHVTTYANNVSILARTSSRIA